MEQSISSEQGSSLKTMQLNDQKAGMQGLDKEAINKVIYEASKGTPYFTFQEKRQQRIDKRANEMLHELKQFSDVQRKEAFERMTALGATFELERDLSRSIVHIDMDAFYAAVEMLDNPDLKSKPMAVGSMSMLATSNYEARKYGVRAAMAGFIAKKLCPDLIIVPPNFKRYKEISKQVRNIVKEYDPGYSVMGLDEVYLDLTQHIMKVYQEQTHSECTCSVRKTPQSSYSDELPDENTLENKEHSCDTCKNIEWNISDSVRDQLAWDIVEEIRHRICEATQLTASAGIAPNTRLAKVCSDQKKPNGQFQIKTDVQEVKKFIATLPVKKISGIGPVQGQLLNCLGIYTCEDMWNKRDIVALLFSERSARFYMRVAVGVGSTEVKSDYIRKSKGLEVTFKTIETPEELHQKCDELCDEIAEDLKCHNIVGKVVVLKIKTVNFDVHTRNATLPVYTSDKDLIWKAAKKLLDGEIKTAAPNPLKLRLMGIRMTNIMDESEVSDSKQAKLTDFLQSRAQSIEANTKSLVKTTKFSCPICEEELNCSLSAFNAHVDECLSNGSLTDIENVAEISIRCSEKLERTENCPHAETIQNGNCVVTQNGETVGSESAEVVERKPLCPVCGIEQKSSDLSELNAHIDACLNRMTIKELLSSEAQLKEITEKRKSSPTKQTGKKLRTGLQKTRKIDDYFR